MACKPKKKFVIKYHITKTKRAKEFFMIPKNYRIYGVSIQSNQGNGAYKHYQIVAKTKKDAIKTLKASGKLEW